jgi:glycosyltransferase involved in cell wall biosynthesis
LKIIHIANLSRIGGIERLVQDLVSAQLEQGLDCTVQSPIWQRNHPHMPDYHHNGILKSGFDLTPSRIIKQANLFKDYDIIHFHGFGLGLYLAAILSRKQIVHTEHGTFQKANQKKSIHAFIKKRFLGYYFLNHFAHAVVFNSRWLQRNVGLKTTRQYVIHNGAHFVETERRHPVAELNAVFKVLFVGRMVVRKRVDRLIKAFSLLSQDGKQKLIFVGDGPLRNDLEKQCADCLPSGAFEFLGFRKDIESIYADAQVLVLPTEFEPFGLVVLEGILRGVLPLMFSDAGGAIEIVQGLEERLIARDVEHMAELIEYWRRNESLRQEKVTVLRQRVMAMFNVGRMEKEYRQVYHKVLKTGSVE